MLLTGSIFLFISLISKAYCQNETTTVVLPTTTPTPCWLEAFPPPNKTRNEITCEICTVIFEGLDDTLLENEEQVY